MTQCQGSRAQMIRLFFGLHLYLARRYCEIPRVQGAPRNVNPAWAKPWLFGITIYCTFFNKDSLPPRQVFHEKRLSEKKAWGNAY